MLQLHLKRYRESPPGGRAVSGRWRQIRVI